ncbi:hypothetical protein EV217_1948 [Phyllobacterium myrsinacearum]|uniref:hypothetical protein n=1 Tax=Phyllobacterium myrsinacearum TaxID=28101 RepID=UPI001028A3D3|nr:hypothetical protein [Phyllobacterium myrsinacearum]RZS83207.1 hypothetical protein EV217_1948 [Phyllobacterium myrsinacearum]
MSEMHDKISPMDARRRLGDAIRGAQVAAADRGDVVIDMKEADLARIEILAQDLQPVFDDVPADDEQWDFAISTGLQPRLWIDATAHVMMGRDRRTYRFVRDTRLGRTVLAESPEVKPVSDAVTTYIAERIVERQRMMEGERISLRPEADAVPRGPAEPTPQPAAPAVQLRQHRSMANDFVNAVIWLLIGAFAGAGALLAFFWDRLSPYF